jgi:rhamnose transport system permease protein
MIQRYTREISVGVAYAALLLILAWKAPRFYRLDHLQPVLVAMAPVLVAAVGMTLVILARQIDISIGAQFSVCGIVAGLLAKMGLPMPLVAGGTVAAGAGMGAVNGLLVAWLHLPSIVVTLATLVIWGESLRWWREGEPVRGLPPDFQWFGWDQATGRGLVVGIALAVFLAFAWGMRYLVAGRAIYATGSDEEAARLAGMRTKRVIFAVFVVLGALTGLAALLSGVRFPDMEANTGAGSELKMIAAVVVGGAAVSGGRGTLAGTLIGVALLGTIGPALEFLRVTAPWEKAIQGLIILLAVASDALYRRAR